MNIWRCENLSKSQIRFKSIIKSTHESVFKNLMINGRSPCVLRKLLRSNYEWQLHELMSCNG